MSSVLGRKAETPSRNPICPRRTVAVVVLTVGLGAPPGALGQPSLGQAAADAASADPRVRRALVRDLAQQGSPEALAILGRLVIDPLDDIQAKAIDAVMGVYVIPPGGGRPRDVEEAFDLAPYRVVPYAAPPELVEGLVRALADNWPGVRRDAVYALGAVSTPPVSTRVADELMQSLGDREPSVRLAAARVLGQLGVARAGLSLIAGVNDVSLPVRLASMRALGEIGEPLAVVALTEQFHFYERGSAGRAAIDALALIAHPSSAGLFQAQTASPNSAHRRSAYEGLARLGAVAAAPSIASALSAERDAEVLAAMAFALAGAGQGPAHLDYLVASLAERQMARQVLGYLVELGRPQAAALAGHLRHENASVRELIAIALGFIGGAEAESALERAAADADPAVSQAARAAQARLRVPRAPAPARPSVLP